MTKIYWQDQRQYGLCGADVGTQYRSAVFYLSESQKEAAEHYKKRLNKSGTYAEPIITEITKAGKYYPAKIIIRIISCKILTRDIAAM